MQLYIGCALLMMLFVIYRNNKDYDEYGIQKRSIGNIIFIAITWPVWIIVLIVTFVSDIIKRI